MMNRLIYTVVLWLLLPYVFGHLLWRARKQPEYLQHIGERFGFYRHKPVHPVIWLHTVSVGETRAAATLVQGLLARYPEHHILLTHTTPTGRAAGEQLYGDRVLRAYLPYDYPFAVRRFLKHFRPHLGVLLETEVWFNLIHTCRRRQLPLLLLNGRLSEKSAASYARFAKLSRSGLHELYLVAAQTEADAMRFATLGNRAVPVMGNLKFDIQPPPAQLELGAHLRERFGNSRPILLAASTREGEEPLILDMLDRINVPNLLLVLVPRHPQRFDEVAALLTQRGLPFQRRSSNEAIAPETRVVLGDSMGEMFAYYAACDAAFIGGSLLPLGGQNLIEACALGKPVLVGPHTFNFAQATEQALAYGAAIQVRDADALATQITNLLTDAAHLSQMGQAGKQFVASNAGATERALMLIGQAYNHAVYTGLISNRVESDS